MIEDVKIPDVFPIEWTFACSFPDSYKKPVRDSFDYWDSLTRKKLFTELKVCDKIGLNFGVIVVDYSDKSKEDSTKESYTIAQTSRVLGTFIVITFFREWTDPDNAVDLVTVGRHEVGHAIGFDHSSSRRCLMYETIIERKKGVDAGVCRSELRLLKRHYGQRRRHRH